MKTMYVQHLIGVPSPLLPDENLRLTRKNLRAVTLYCALFSRSVYERFFSFILLRVTNRRVNISCQLFPLFIYRQEVNLWFPGHHPNGPVDIITAVSVKTGIYGPCVELRSRDPVRRQSLFSSPDLTARIYEDEPDLVAQAILEAFRGEDVAERKPVNSPLSVVRGIK